MRKTSNRNGMLLIATIIAMVLVSILGLAVVSLTATSTYSRVVAGQSNRAYYLAESGWNYALSQYRKNGTIIAKNTVQSFSLSANERFTIEGIESENGSNITFVTIGIVDEGTGVEARRKLTYNFKRGSVGYEELDLSFNETPPDNKLDPTWSVDSGWAGIKQPGKDYALSLKQQNNSTLDRSFISLNTQSEPYTNLQFAWVANGNLLSYDMQAKMMADSQGNKGNYYMLGLSFRLDVAKTNSYGVSFFYGISGADEPLWYSSLVGFEGAKTNRPSIVLWKESGGVITLLAYSILQPASGTVYSETDNKGVTSWYLSDWSTILLNLNEVYDSNGARQNQISVYIQNNVNYPRSGTTKWTTNDFYQVTWANGVQQPVIDSTHTSADFDTRRPEEIGVHAFYDSNANMDLFLDDFSVRVDFGGTGGGGVVEPVVY